MEATIIHHTHSRSQNSIQVAVDSNKQVHTQFSGHLRLSHNFCTYNRGLSPRSGTLDTSQSGTLEIFSQSVNDHLTPYIRLKFLNINFYQIHFNSQDFSFLNLVHSPTYAFSYQRNSIVRFNRQWSWCWFLHIRKPFQPRILLHNHSKSIVDCW